MSLFNRRFTPAYDILQAKKRAGAPSFAELDNSRLLPKNGTAGQVPVVQADGRISMDIPKGMSDNERSMLIRLVVEQAKDNFTNSRTALGYKGGVYDIFEDDSKIDSVTNVNVALQPTPKVGLQAGIAPSNTFLEPFIPNNPFMYELWEMKDLKVSADGTIMVVSGRANSGTWSYYEFEFGSPWQASTLKFKGTNPLGSLLINGTFAYAGAGEHLYILQGTSLSHLKLTVPYSILGGFKILETGITVPHLLGGFVIKEDGTKMMGMLSQSNADPVMYEYNINNGGVPYALSSVSLVNSKTWAGQNSNFFIPISGLCYDNVGNNFYTITTNNGYTSYEVQIQLTTAWDLSTASNSLFLMGLPYLQATSKRRSLFIGLGGVYAYIADETGAAIYQKSAGARTFANYSGYGGQTPNYAYGTYASAPNPNYGGGVANPNSEEGNHKALSWANDGLKLYRLDKFGRRLFQYDCTIAYDEGSAELIKSRNVASLGYGAYNDIHVSNDGNWLFFTNWSSLYRVNLTTPHDIDTLGTYTYLLNNIISFAISKDGTKIVWNAHNVPNVVNYGTFTTAYSGTIGQNGSTNILSAIGKDNTTHVIYDAGNDGSAGYMKYKFIDDGNMLVLKTNKGYIFFFELNSPHVVTGLSAANLYLTFYSASLALGSYVTTNVYNAGTFSVSGLAENGGGISLYYQTGLYEYTKIQNFKGLSKYNGSITRNIDLSNDLLNPPTSVIPSISGTTHDDTSITIDISDGVNTVTISKEQILNNTSVDCSVLTSTSLTITINFISSGKYNASEVNDYAIYFSE